MSSKRLLTLVCSVGLVLILVLVSLMAACAKPAPTPTPTPTPKPTPTPTPTPELPEVRLIYSGYSAAKVTYEVAVRDFGALVTERTGGKVTFDYYSGSSLLKVAETLQGIQSGICDFGDVNLMYYPSMLPLSSVCLVPYVTRDPYAQSKAMIELGTTWQPMKDEYAKYDTVPLFFVFGEPTYLFTKNIVRSMADLKDLKLRATSWGAYTVEKWGASPISMSAGDIYTSVERGMIDGCTNMSWRGNFSFHVYEHSPYIMDPGIGLYTAHYMCMNKSVWDSLPQQYRDALYDAGREIEANLLGVANETNEGTTSDLAQYMKPVVWTAAEVAKLRNAVVPDVWDAWIEKMTTELGATDAPEMLERYRAICEKYEPDSTYKDCLELVLEKVGPYTGD